MVKRLVTLVLLSYPLILGCNEKNVKEKEYMFADFYVRYLESEQEIKAQASFLEGIDEKNAEPKAFLGGVTFQSRNMNFRDLREKGMRYTYLDKGVYMPQVRFSYKDDAGSLQEIRDSMDAIKQFMIKGPVHKLNGMHIVAEGGALDESEQLVVLFQDAENKASTVIFEGPHPSMEYFINSEQMTGFNIGKGTIYLVKKRASSQNEGSNRIHMLLEFYTESLPVEVMP